MERRLPGIGLRIVKSAIAIALCFVVDAFRNGSGIVFYSQLSALWCMQVYRDNTKKNAIQRTIGTTVGAIYGLFFLLLNAKLRTADNGYGFLSAMLISMMIIVVLYTTVLLKKKQASYFSCVVFLSIVVNHLGDANPYLFVWNRFLDTMIGILIGIGVNNFEIYKKKNRDVLFISTMDETLLNSNEKLSDYSKAELNRLIDDGLKFSVATMRTPAIICENLRDINLQYPVIAMDGAVLFDVSQKKYLKSYVISAPDAVEIRQFLERFTRHYFTNIIIDDTLLIYYQEDMNGAMGEVVANLRSSPYRNYIMRQPPDDESVVYYMILDRTEFMQRLYKVLDENGYTEHYKIVLYESKQYEGCSYIKIFNKNASMGHMMDYLQEYVGLNKHTTIGTIEGKYDVTVTGLNANEAVKDIKALYENKKIIKNS